ncbi:GNAT family N-acetyltransferase [Flagellimonas algicola]|uniref:GNAT family N-acetyltransferase n=1 Tax=Flagellimonas algicola TaxID=2583815 RepID=A0ABY2WJ71_9FLAO|nr:GNAT family N-acetyltransferase [Allomuricauda algicola]TMU54469.1 GNAT family N-acetyltransferase [Allomuricauda algicola]
MKKTTENIENLTGLWKLAGQQFIGYEKDNTILSSFIQGSEWPNKIWTEAPLSEDLISQLRDKMEQNPQLTFSYFNTNTTDNPLLTERSFELQFNQTGMSMPLKSLFATQKVLDFKRVETGLQAALWSTAFQSAFGYDFGARTLEKTLDKVPYYLVYHNKELVGTIILYKIGKIAGVHALGIIPEKRKQGYATEIMYNILNKAIKDGLEWATLQASPMAKNMYLKMGFTVDFLMQNYKLKQD